MNQQRIKTRRTAAGVINPAQGFRIKSIVLLRTVIH